MKSNEAMQYDNLDKDRNINLLVNKFEIFLQKGKTLRFGKVRKLFKKNKASTANLNFTCFESGN